MNSTSHPMKRTGRYLCLIHLVSILLAGCSTGVNDFAPKLPAASRATLILEGSTSLTGGRLGVGVDGLTANKIKSHWWHGAVTMYLTPGKHTLILHYDVEPPGLFIANALRGGTGLGNNQPGGMKEWLLTSGEQPYHLDFEARAGHTYTVKYSDNRSHWKVWLKDSLAGKEISSQVAATGGPLSKNF